MTLKSRNVLFTALLVVILVFYTRNHEPALASYSLSPILLPAVAGEEEELLKEVLPQADSFSSKGGNLRHYKGYQVDDQTGRETLVGFVFLTADVEPLEWGYEGPIIILVGMTTEGVITEIKVLEHHEPYGYFSIDLPSFADQFRGKSILEPFSVGRDIDAISRATITVKSATRGIRNSARRIAKQYLAQARD
jgi:transcriptional regulator of nitric oxide reductase